MIMNNKRIVVKVGTSTLTHPSGSFNLRHIESLVKVLSDIKNSGVEIVLVTSGAIGLGMAKLGLRERPKDTPTKQACAAVGQCELMNMYDRLFGDYNVTVAQVLLTKYVISDERKDNVLNALDRIISSGAVPIVNENDVVAIDELELEVGENDSLAAIVSVLVGADLLIIMSDIEGLYDKNPREHRDAKLISRVESITDEIENYAEGAGTDLGTGGMATKIRAAKIANSHGVDMLIINGSRAENLYDVMDGKIIGTLFTSENREE